MGLAKSLYFVLFLLMSATAMAEIPTDGPGADIGDVALLRAGDGIEQMGQFGGFRLVVAEAVGGKAEQSEEQMKRYQKRQCTWLRAGYITAVAGVSCSLFLWAVDVLDDGTDAAIWAVPGGVLLGMSAASLVIAHNNSLKAKRYAPDLTRYQIGRLRSIGKAAAIAGATNLVVVLILDNVLSADTELIGFAAPAIGFGIASAVCFIKANNKEKKLSLGATALREPTGFGKSVARPALSLCLNF